MLVALAIGGVGRAADGDLDQTFSSNGKVVTAFPGGAFATSVAIQPDGKLVVAGAAAGAGESVSGEFALARYETGGSLDQTFGAGGLVTTPVSAGGGGEGRDFAIQADGRIVVVGTAGRVRFAAARYETDGTLDETFGNGGIVRTNITDGFDIAHGVVIQPNGRIVLVGQAGTSRPAFALVRYLHDGSLDLAFGDGGKVRTPLRDLGSGP